MPTPAGALRCATGALLPAPIKRPWRFTGPAIKITSNRNRNRNRNRNFQFLLQKLQRSICKTTGCCFFDKSGFNRKRRAIDQRQHRGRFSLASLAPIGPFRGVAGDSKAHTALDR